MYILYPSLPHTFGCGYEDVILEPVPMDIEPPPLAHTLFLSHARAFVHLRVFCNKQVPLFSWQLVVGIQISSL